LNKIFKNGYISAILSAILYGISIPLSKIFLSKGVNPVVLGGFTYLGAGGGLLLFNLINLIKKKPLFQNSLGKNELPYVISMVILDISAIALLMLGLSKTNSSNASLLSNFEIVSTSLIAFFIFKEKISKKLWSAIILIIGASIILSCIDLSCLKFSHGSIFVLLSYLFWGMENNCTKMLSSKNTSEITIIKGIFSGLGSLVIAYFLNYSVPSLYLIIFILLAGFLTYGISVKLYILSQNLLGAVKTAGCFSYAPYIAIIFSILILKEIPDLKFYIALIIMICAAFLIYKDN